MSKIKYKFDPNSLSYQRIILTPGQKLLRLLKRLGTLTVIASILIVILLAFFDTPEERQQKRENKLLLDQYEILNDKLGRMELTMEQIKERDDHIYRTIFAAEPVPASVREAGFGGINRYRELDGYKNSELVINTSQKLDKLVRKLDVQWKSYNEVMNLAKEKETFLASIPAISPLSGKDLTRFASGYGFRIHPIYRTQKMHTGIDLTAPVGTIIYATGDGRVEDAGYTLGGYGKRIVIDHGFGFKTLYAHLNDIKVKTGQGVKRGEIIGSVGSSGRSTAPHLHYEVIKNDNTENPINYYYNDLTPDEYEQVIEISSQMNMSFD